MLNPKMMLNNNKKEDIKKHWFFFSSKSKGKTNVDIASSIFS
jgi:hypothetical protein